MLEDNNPAANVNPSSSNSGAVNKNILTGSDRNDGKSPTADEKPQKTATKPVKNESVSKKKRLSQTMSYKRKACMNFIYNREKKTYCGRTCGGWGKLCIYYFTFLMCILAFFLIIMMIILSVAESNNAPLFTIPVFDAGETNSVLNFFPMDDFESRKISYSKKDTTKIENMVKAVDTKLSLYTKEEVQDCTNKKSKEKSELIPVEGLPCDEYEGCESSEEEREFLVELPCRFNASQLGPCYVKPYGYGTDMPCIYLKINKILGWEPKPYGKKSILPETMPEQVKQLIRQSDIPKLWVHCEGETEPDKKQISEIFYYPEQAFHPQYFPYVLNGRYQSPLIAVQTKVKDPRKPWTLACFLWMQETYIIELAVSHSVTQD